MIDGLALALALASAGTTAEPPRFADDFPQGVGYVVTLKIIPDEDGIAKTCAFSSILSLAEGASPVKVSPPDTYVIDACRKLRNAKWEVARDESGHIEAQFYFCRYVESSPNVAFCDRQLGE